MLLILCFLKVRSQQGPLQASIDERSEELAELVGMLAKALKSKYDNTIDLFNHISLNVFL